MSGGYEDEENLMSVPDYGESNSSDYSNSSYSSSGYEDNGSMMSTDSGDDFSKYEDEDQLMSIDPRYNKPNMSYADGRNQPGYTNHYSNPESSMMCSYDYGESSLYGGNNPYCNIMSHNDPMMSYITDSPMNPHAVLDVLDDVSVDKDTPYINVLAIASDGTRSSEKVRVTSEKPGYLYWSAQNASNVMLNGAKVPIAGSMEIRFDKTNEGAYWPYEVVAWNDDLAKAEYTVIDVHFLEDVAEGAEFERALTFPQKSIERSYAYFDVSYKISVALKGSFAFNEGESNRTYKWQDGVAVEFTKEFKSGNWKFEPKVEFSAPVLKHDMDDSQKLVEAKVAGEGSYTFTIGDSSDIVVFFEIASSLIEISRERTIDAKWEPKVLNFELKGGAKWIGKIKTVSGTFAGTLSVAVVASVNPNWSKILTRLTSRFGTNLGTGGAGAALGLVAGVVTSPTFLASAAVGTVVLGIAKIVEANGPRVYRTEVIPGLMKNFREGIEAGIRGHNHSSQEVAVVDNASAKKAGITTGTKMRLALEQNKEPFDEKSNQQAFISAVQGAAQYKLEIDLWVMRARPLKSGSWFSSDYEDCGMQMSWWNNIIGDCPQSKGSGYLKVWKNNVIDCPEHWAHDGDW